MDAIVAWLGVLGTQGSVAWSAVVDGGVVSATPLPGRAGSVAPIAATRAWTPGDSPTLSDLEHQGVGGGELTTVPS